MKIITGIQLNAEELNQLQYPIIVHKYNQCSGQKSCGKQRRAYLKEFNEKGKKINLLLLQIILRLVPC